MAKSFVLSAALARLAAQAVAGEAPGAFRVNGPVREQVRAVRQVALAPDGKCVGAMINLGAASMCAFA